MPDKASLPAVLRSVLGLNDTETQILLRLMTWERIAREQICALATCGHQSIKLSSVNGIVSGLRKKLSAHGVEITTNRDFGFELPRKARRRCSSCWPGPPPMEAPRRPRGSPPVNF
jgi:DNA-binding response OmpR family regulator